MVPAIPLPLPNRLGTYSQHECTMRSMATGTDVPSQCNVPFLGTLLCLLEYDPIGTKFEQVVSRFDHILAAATAAMERFQMTWGPKYRAHGKGGGGLGFVTHILQTPGAKSAQGYITGDRVLFAPAAVPRSGHVGKFHA